MGLTDKLTAIGNAIREMTNERKNFKLDEMPDEIISITTDDCKLSELAKGSISIIPVEYFNKINKIRDYAFYGCQSLKNIIMLDNIQTIGTGAFQNSFNLENIVISNGVKIIGANAFQNCRGLKSITIEATNPPTLGSNAFNGCSSNLKIYVPQSAVDAYKTKSGWSSYTGMITGNTTQSSLNYTEEGQAVVVNGIKPSFNSPYINIPSEYNNKPVNSIDGFSGWAAFIGVMMPDSVKEIRAEAFNSCRGLTSVIMGNNVTRIGAMAFYECAKLTSITIKTKVPPELRADAFSGCSSSLIIFVPKGCVGAYQEASGWSDYSDKIQEAG